MALISLFPPSRLPDDRSLQEESSHETSYLRRGGGSVLPGVVVTLDRHVERPITIMTARLVPSIDVFNVGNFNTVQALQRQQNASTADNISAVLAPRIVRFGIRVNW